MSCSLLHQRFQRRLQALRFQNQRAQREQHLPDFFGGRARQRFDLFQFFRHARGRLLQQGARVVDAHGDGGHALRGAVVQIARQFLAGVFFNLDDARFLGLQAFEQLRVLQRDGGLIAHRHAARRYCRP